MNNYIASDNCSNNRFRDNLVDQQNMFMDQRAQECAHTRENNNIGDCDESTSMKTSDVFSNADGCPVQYNCNVHQCKRQHEQYELQHELQHEQQHEQHHEQHEGYSCNPHRTLAHPIGNYSEIDRRQFVREHLEEPQHEHMSSANYTEGIPQYEMSNDLYNRSNANLCPTEMNKNNYEIPHELKKGNKDHLEPTGTNMFIYNKKKSPFSTDSVQDSLKESPIRGNNIYGDYENYNPNEKDDTFYAKQRHVAYEPMESPLRISSLKDRNLQGHCDSSEKKEFIGQESPSYTKGCDIHKMNYMNNEPSGHYYQHNVHNEYIKDDISICSSTAKEQKEHANVFKEKNMSHTKIFDYIEPSKNAQMHEQKEHKKKFVDTFVPRYKNVSARETLLKNLSGNDNITVLAANSMEFDEGRYKYNDKNVLPNVYPFNISDRVETVQENKQTKRNIPKLLPVNYNYVNNYTTSNRNGMSLSQIRNHMTSSHIFDTDEPQQPKQSSHPANKETNTLTTMTPHNRENRGDFRMEQMDINEKRKKNPMYTDLFGRETPDTHVQETQKEKLLSATMQNNWMYHASDVKKYAEPSMDNMSNSNYERPDSLEPNQDKFHRKSYFGKDGYDNTKRLQDALKKGSNYALQAHLQSSILGENEDKNNYLTDAHTVQTYYLTLYNLKDSLQDEEIKKIVKSSEAYLVSYKPDYDLLSNIRKSTAKMCVRHNKGKQGLQLLQHLFSQVQVKAVEQ